MYTKTQKMRTHWIINKAALAAILLIFSLLLVNGCRESVIIGDIQANPAEKVQVGQAAIVSVAVDFQQPMKTELKFYWKAERGQIDPKGTKEISVAYTAPSEPGPDTITLEVKNRKGEQIALRSKVIQVVESREEAPPTEQQPEEPEPEPPPPKTKTINITSPKDGEKVGMVTTVQFSAPKPEQGKYLVVFVRPLPNDPNQEWWVQSRPIRQVDGTWSSSPVYVGISSDKPGTPFVISVVLTDKPHSRGDHLPIPPPGISDSVNVTRK